MLKSIKTIINDHFVYRKQIIKLAKADLVKTYRGSALGWTWAIIKPVVTIFVYWFAFSFGIRKSGDINGFPFFLWLIAGVVPWFYMNEMLSQGTDSIRKYSYLVTKMKFPISTIPTFVSLSKFFVSFVLILIVIAIFWASGYPPDIYYLQIPFYMILSFIFFTLWGLFGSMLAAISKDFSNLVKSFISAILWMSGILWDIDEITIPWLRRFLMLNPVTFLVTGFRNAFVNEVWFFQQPKRLMYFTILTCILACLALWSYRKLRKEIPDVL